MATFSNPPRDNKHFGGYHQYNHVRQRPPSPPMEDSRCSLPSISNLLGLADAGSSTRESSPSSQLDSPRPGRVASLARQSWHEASSAASLSRPGSSSQHQRTLPPTPPMAAEPCLDSTSSSSMMIGRIPSFSAPTSYAFDGAPSEADPYRQPQVSNYPPTSMQGGPLPPAILPPDQATPAGAFHASELSHPRSNSMAPQRSLPDNFSPLAIPVTVAPPSSNPWQHHHYLSPSPGSSYAQNQDRYICPTCNKAFSRPSSLRIHSHSHTGEKPFKCPHLGCGKAFSVRSNMKRHERGCHSFDVSPGGPPFYP